MDEKKTTKKKAASTSTEVVLPFEKATKNYLKFSTLESRDRDTAKDDTAVLSSAYIRKTAFTDVPTAIKVTIEAA